MFIVALLVARALPLPVPGNAPIIRPSSTGHRLPPALILHDNLSLYFGDRSFNLSLTGGHHYMWRFNVTYGSIMINLTDVASHAVVWSVGPRSSGPMYLNGVGVASFNWTAPGSGYYLLTFQSLSPSQWIGVSGPSVCEVSMWDLDGYAPSFIFQTGPD